MSNFVVSTDDEDKIELLKFLMKLRSMSVIERCSNTHHLAKYSVAEHSYYTTLIAIVIADLENENIKADAIKQGKKNYYQYDIAEVMRKAFFHDMEESLTGDILFPVKHSDDDDLSNEFSRMANFVVEKALFKELPTTVRETYIKTWQTAKDSSPEGRLVAAADKIEILLFAYIEISTGNVFFRKIYNNAVKLIKEEFYDILTIKNLLEEISKYANYNLNNKKI